MKLYKEGQWDNMVLFAEYSVAVLFCNAFYFKPWDVTFSQARERKAQHSKTVKNRDTTTTTRTKEG